MEGLIELSQNKYIYIPLILWFVIQLFKVLCDIIKNKKIDFRRIMGAGGMPSSHSAVVTSITTLIGKDQGFNSPIFALAFVFAFIVMYDACGVRRAAGKQAAVLNKIIQTPRLTGIEISEKLVELLGHTPIQVLAGAAIGIGVGLIF